VPEYRISLRARRTLMEVFEFTESFGRYQADAYHAGFEKTFGLIAEFPRIGRAADDLTAGLRRFRFQSHHIFYKPDDGYVLIVQIFHVSQDVRPELFE
jgi:toxin ParE1/3/4